MAVIRSKFSREQLAEQKVRDREAKQKKKGKKAGSSSGSADGAPQRMAILSLVGAIFWGLTIAFQANLMKRLSDQPIKLPASDVGSGEGSSLALKMYNGVFGEKSVLMSFSEINAALAPTESSSTTDGAADSQAPPSEIYFTPHKDNLLVVISMPLKEFVGEEKYLNGTILLKPEKVAGEPLPLLKISKMQVNKVDLTEGEMKSARNMFNLGYGAISFFLRLAESYPQLGMPPLDPTKTGDVTDKIRMRIEGDSLRFNPSEEDNHFLPGATPTPQ